MTRKKIVTICGSVLGLIIVCLFLFILLANNINCGNKYSQEKAEDNSKNNYSQEKISDNYYKIHTEANDVLYLEIKILTFPDYEYYAVVYDENKKEISSQNIEEYNNEKIELVSEKDSLRVYKLFNDLICKSDNEYYVVSLSGSLSVQSYKLIEDENIKKRTFATYKIAFESNNWQCITGCAEVLVSLEDTDTINILKRFSKGQFEDNEKKKFTEQKVNLSEITAFSDNLLKKYDIKAN